ncbi:unnamed protein product [Ectocarpus sp. 6 AP-2014]
MTRVNSVATLFALPWADIVGGNHFVWRLRHLERHAHGVRPRVCQQLAAPVVLAKTAPAHRNTISLPLLSSHPLITLGNIHATIPTAAVAAAAAATWEIQQRALEATPRGLHRRSRHLNHGVPLSFMFFPSTVLSSGTAFLFFVRRPGRIDHCLRCARARAPRPYPPHLQCPSFGLSKTEELETSHG